MGMARVELAVPRKGDGFTVRCGSHHRVTPKLGS